MMHPWHDLPVGDHPPERVTTVIEIPTGCRNKYELDKASGMLRLDRVLYSAVHYPGDYGFIPRTLHDDGDPLDMLVHVNEPTFPGCQIEVRPARLHAELAQAVRDRRFIRIDQREEDLRADVARARAVAPRLLDRGEPDDKILGVPVSDPYHEEYYDIADLPAHYLKEVEHFFAIYKDLEGKRMQTMGWGKSDEAMQIISASIAKYAAKYGPEGALRA